MEMENRSDLIGIGINFCTGTFSGKIWRKHDASEHCWQVFKVRVQWVIV